MSPFMFSQLVGSEEPLLAISALESTNLKVTPFVTSKQRGLGKLFATFQTFKRFLFIVTAHVLQQENSIFESSITLVANKLAIIVGQEQCHVSAALALGDGGFLLDLDRVQFLLVQEPHLAVVKDNMTGDAFVFARSDQLQMLHQQGSSFKDHFALVALKR